MIAKYKIPPYVSMFQPTTTIFENNITFEEFLVGILCRLNEVIDLVNKHEEFVETYSGKIEEIEAKVTQLYQDFETYKIQTDEYQDQTIQIDNSTINNNLNEISKSTIYYNFFKIIKL